MAFGQKLTNGGCGDSRWMMGKTIECRSDCGSTLRCPRFPKLQQFLTSVDVDRKCSPTSAMRLERTLGKACKADLPRPLPRPACRMGARPTLQRLEVPRHLRAGLSTFTPILRRSSRCPATARRQPGRLSCEATNAGDCRRLAYGRPDSTTAVGTASWPASESADLPHWRPP